MTTQEAKTLLSKIEFLHFKFELEPIDDMQARLSASLITPDTRDRRTDLDIVHQRNMIPSMCDEEYFIVVVHDFVLDILKHEVGELFRVSGVDVFNEHTGNGIRILQEMFKKESV